MTDLRAELSPMRMVLAERTPVEMMVELMNNTNKTLMISLDIILDDEISFDKGGRSSFQTKKFDALKPGERFMQYYDIFPKANVNRGIHNIEIILVEHFNNSWECAKQEGKIAKFTY